MNNFFRNIRQFLSRLSLGQQLALGLVLAGGVAVIVSISMWANQTDYTLLFGDLDPSDASTVVESLREDDIAYELRENGTAVYVPHGQVYELRLRFAAEGVLSQDQMGYELFDRSNMGMTDFMQKMNKKRALEGELARTISSMRQVEMARVHLVLPERSPFRESEVKASASVVVQPMGNIALKASQIEGISGLVAGAVGGMTTAEVTVLDTEGNMLSDPNAGDPTMSLTSTQLDMQREVEAHLTDNGQSMLDRVVGRGSSIVRVNANLDFSRTVSERDLIDPESRTIISEEQLSEEGAEDQSESEVRNYELSRTRERREDGVGEVSSLTVSVILNYKQPRAQVAADDAADEAADDEEPEPTPYTEEELQEIESLVKNAVGFDPERGDRFAIHQTRFDTNTNNQFAAQMGDQAWENQLELYLRYGFLALALGLGAWLIRSIAQRGAEMSGDLLLNGQSPPGGAPGQRQLEGQQQAGGGDGAADSEDDTEDMVLVDDVYTSKLSSEAKARLVAKNKMYEEIQEQVIGNPEEAADLIRSWLVDDRMNQQN